MTHINALFWNRSYVCSRHSFAFSRLRQDRLRQEQLARERLAQLRDRKKAKEQETEDKLVTDGDLSVLQEAVMKALEHKHQDERQVKFRQKKDLICFVVRGVLV